MQAYKPSYSKWEAHFKTMANGGSNRNGRTKIVSVKTPPQSGSAVSLVTPAQQIIEMAQAKKRKAIKASNKRSELHSASSSQRSNISKKTKRAKKSKPTKRRRKNKNG